MAKSDDYPLLTDDYVAELVAKEASDFSLRYSAMGLEADNKPEKRPANQPKPNTRFLNNIIRDTDSHNRALLAKESAESQARLRDLEHADEKKRQAEQQRLKRMRPGPGDTRKRMLGDIAAIIGKPSKRRKVNDGESKPPHRSSRNSRKELFSEHTSDKEHNSKHRLNGNARKELFSERDGKHTKSSLSMDHDGEETPRSRSREHSHRQDEKRRDRDSRHRGTATESGRDKEDVRTSRGRGRDHRDLFDDRKSRDSQSNLRLDNLRLDTPQTDETSHGEFSDSDPLEDIIGPSLPKPASPVRKRGRGATIRSSGIDRRFAEGYDPKTDVALNEDENDDDWGSALEALRDRQKWKQQGANRLRAAGFTDDQVKKWEKGGSTEQDVRWTQKGEQREWDRGKSFEADGSVKIRARV